jgi:hypothetical protein
MPLPHAAILQAVHAALTAALSVDVRYAGAGGDAPDTYVALQMLPATPRDTLTSRGYDAQFVCRVHTEHAIGHAAPLAAYSLADQVDTALEGATLDLGAEHAALDVQSPTRDENQYSIDQGREALDVILTFTILTQQTV